MTASLTIKYAIAAKSSYDILFQALIENTGTRGMVKLKTFNKDSGVCVEDTGMTTEKCLNPTSNSYISQIYSRLISYRSGSTFSRGCLRIYNCSSGDNCDARTCNSWNTSPDGTNDNVDVGPYFGVIPIAVRNFTLTPGNGTITASWDEPGNAPIFANFIFVERVSDGVTIVSGHVIRTNVVISNLQNGISYKVHVLAVSEDGNAGPESILTSTPGAPCIVPVCNFIAE